MSKLKFLWGILVKANFLYNEAVKQDAQHISGEIRMDVVKESYCTSYGEPETWRLTMGQYQPIYWTLRPWQETKPSE